MDWTWRRARCGGSSSGAASRSKKTAHASEQHRPDVARRRQAWFEAQPDLDPERLVFIDETGASTKMARRYGRSPRGIPTATPELHWVVPGSGRCRLVGELQRDCRALADVTFHGKLAAMEFHQCLYEREGQSRALNDLDIDIIRLFEGL